MHIGKKILIIDDDVQLGAMFAATLRAQEFIVAVTASGQTALKLLSKQAFDLVLCDVMMPIMDGFEVVKALKKMNIPSLKVVLFSNLAIDVLEKKIDKKVVTDLWYKDDLTVSELVSRVKKLYS